MSIENKFNTANRETKHGQPRVSLHGRRAVERVECGQNEIQAPRTGLAQATPAVSPEPPTGQSPWWVLLGARLFDASLDRKLAEGQAPESSPLLAARAQLLASPAERRGLAESWLSLLVEAREPVALLSPRVPLIRERILAAQTLIQALAGALSAPMLTSRGVAMTSTLRCDGSGPIYNRECTADLGSALREVIARLDPLAS